VEDEVLGVEAILLRPDLEELARLGVVGPDGVLVADVEALLWAVVDHRGGVLHSTIRKVRGVCPCKGSAR
jgi:hypothetical protein